MIRLKWRVAIAIRRLAGDRWLRLPYAVRYLVSGWWVTGFAAGLGSVRISDLGLAELEREEAERS